MHSKVLRLLSRPYNNIFVLTGALIIIFAGAVYFIFNKEATRSLNEQMLHREQIMARSGAISVGVFVQSLSDQISAFSLISHIHPLDPVDAQNDLELFLRGWKNTPLSGLILVDRNGLVRYGLDREGKTGVGINVQEREYFNWAKTADEGDVFIGAPIQSKIGFATGRFIVPVASPLIYNGRFNGVIVSSFLLDELTVGKIDPLKITDRTAIYLVDEGGVIYSGPARELVGVNYQDYISKSGIVGGKKVAEILGSAMRSASEGKLTIALPDETNNNLLTPFLISYSPINIGDYNWMLVIATPQKDALVFMAPFYFRSLGLTGLAFLGFLIIAIRISKIKGYMEGSEEEHKIHAAGPK